MRILFSFSCALLLWGSTVQAQQSNNFGKISPFEQNLESYDKDPQAAAVVLFERGDNYFKVVDERIRLIKEYHVKIKILDEKGFDEGTIELPLFRNKNAVERLTKIKAVTHNNGKKYSVLPKEIYGKVINEYKSVKSFTFPKLQKGSILEYSYTITSPFTYNFEGWSFQSHIPKIYSEFNAKIPGNYVYNRAMHGPLKLLINRAYIQKNCFHIGSFAKDADCEVLKYAMKDIPAFKAEKDFMLAASNYISRMDFELSQYHRFDGRTDKYTKTWKAVDREFRSDKNIGQQLTKKNFFQKKVPNTLLTQGTPMEKAQRIYEFVQDHFTWTERYGIYGKARVKNAFEARKGNVSEINMTLINLLNAAGIQTNLMLLSTRQSGLPKRTHPVMSDFNYIIAKINVDGKEYLLDATDKHNPFGMLPYRALNHYGRVMDFKKESYWYDIVPEKKNQYLVRAQLKFKVEEEVGHGVIDIINTGYNAIITRRTHDENSEEEYLDLMEENIEGDFNITGHKIDEENSDAKKLNERFEFELDNILDGDMVYINPFFIRFFENSPFTLEERNYPIDFGYPRGYKYQINIEVPEGYKVHELPKNRSIGLSDKSASLQFSQDHISTENFDQISILFSLELSNWHFAPENYQSLKTLFKNVTDVQNNSLIVLKKI